MTSFDPVALGIISQVELGYLWGLAGVVCGAIIAAALIKSV